MKALLSLAIAVFVVSCGNKDSDKDGKGRKPTPEQGEQNPDGEEKYFSLMENCDTNSGKAVIDGKCVTLKLTATLDGKVSIASLESENSVFAGGIGSKAVHSFPFTRYKRENTVGLYSYSIKRQASKVDERSISIDTNVETDDVLSRVFFLADRSKSRVFLEVFGEKFSPEDQDLVNVERSCNRILDIFREKHPLANDSTKYWSHMVDGSYLCFVGNPREFDEDVKVFKRFKIWWRCESEQCYFDSMLVNGL